MLVAALSNSLGKAWKIRIREKRGDTAWQHQAQHPGPFGSQAARGQVGRIASFFNDRLDTLADILAYVGMLVDYTGNSRTRDSTEASDLFKCEIRFSI
jgi:hypothetical protein